MLAITQCLSEFPLFAFGRGDITEGINFLRPSTLLWGIRPVFGGRQRRIGSSDKNLEIFNG
jgi:hypothetical protein